MHSWQSDRPAYLSKKKELGPRKN